MSQVIKENKTALLFTVTQTVARLNKMYDKELHQNSLPQFMET